MKLLEHTKAIREYCDYIDRHIENIRKAWDGLRHQCESMRFVYDDYLHASIESLIVEHDLSKVSPEEFIAYQRRFFPAASETPSLEGFDAAWEHHKANNPHHIENWTAAEYANPYEEMCHCVCMVVDWIAMSYEFGDTAEDFYRTRVDPSVLPDWAAGLIETIFEETRGADWLPCASRDR